MIVSMMDITEDATANNNNNNIESIDLSCNPLWQTIQFSVEEEMALQLFVSSYKRLGFIGYEVHTKQIEERETSYGFWTQLQHVLDLNKVGRCLYDYSTTAAVAEVDPKHHQQRPHHVPIALLPKVLERTQRVFVKEEEEESTSRCASATFHLLQGFVMEHMGGRL
jgi:hypothetical protein